MLYRTTAFFMLLLLLVVGSSCESGDNDLDQPTSEIIVRNASNNAIISTPENKGAITLQVGQNRTIEVIRRVDDGEGPIEETDVTDEADFNFDDDDIAAIDANGQVTGLEAGFSGVTVVYRDDPNDPSQDDTVDFDITVEPAP
jgi:hypothetical protein